MTARRQRRWRDRHSLRRFDDYKLVGLPAAVYHDWQAFLRWIRW